MCHQISPRVMCMGPRNTIFVYERDKKSVSQMKFSRGKLNFHDYIFCEIDEIQGMCFSRTLATVALLQIQDDMTNIVGVSLATRRVAWERSELNRKVGSSEKVHNVIKDITSLPDGRFCIFNHKEILVLDPRDGATLYTLFDFTNRGVIWSISATSTNNKRAEVSSTVW